MARTRERLNRPLSVRLDRDTLHALKTLAKGDNRKLAGYVRLVLKDHVKQAASAPQEEAHG